MSKISKQKQIHKYQQGHKGDLQYDNYHKLTMIVTIYKIIQTIELIK